MTVSAGSLGAIKQNLEPLQAQPSWEWKYTMGPDKIVQLQMDKASDVHRHDMLSVDAAPLSYII